MQGNRKGIAAKCFPQLGGVAEARKGNNLGGQLNIKLTINQPTNKMTNQKESKQVFTTKDYSIFKYINGNREKVHNHLERLRKSMQTQYIMTILIVNEFYQIIDGQHRFEIIRELGLPLHYIICPGYGLDEVHILNHCSKTWSVDDYLTGYCDMRKDDYIKYKAFCDEYKFGHNESMALLSGYETGNGSSFVAFRNGTFKVTHPAEAERKATMIWKLESLYAGFKRRSFVYALLYLFNKPQFIFDEFLTKLKKNPSKLTDCATTSQYITLIEEIYNTRRNPKINLRY